MKPFLKWPGGKRWAAKTIADIARCYLHERGKYIEPFAGSAAVLFELRPSRAILNDINSDLITTYRMVRDNPADLLRKLKNIPVNRNMYYKIRDARPRSDVSRAVRFLYLNRTSFAGMYRLNKQGEFNVPFNGGIRDTSILTKSTLLYDASKCLQNVMFLSGDFERAIALAEDGDVIFCDPTYTVTHNNNGFVRYNERNFSWIDQRRLLNHAVNAAKRGATIVVSNAFHISVHRLYAGWKRMTLKRISTICPSSEYRKVVRESLFIISSRHG
jgi:DNA adenine methylase